MISIVVVIFRSLGFLSRLPITLGSTLAGVLYGVVVSLSEITHIEAGRVEEALRCCRPRAFLDLIPREMLKDVVGLLQLLTSLCQEGWNGSIPPTEEIPGEGGEDLYQHDDLLADPLAIPKFAEKRQTEGESQGAGDAEAVVDVGESG